MQAPQLNYWIGLGTLRGTLIAVDGSPVKRIALGTMPLAIAQRADILIELPAGPGAYPILAQVEGKVDRTGIVLATPGAEIGRIDGHAATPAPAIDFAFEQALRAAEPPTPPTVKIVRDVLLSGDMQAYIWKMNNEVYPDIKPIVVTTGRLVELVMRNQTMMSHPMHLHGHRFQVVGLDRPAVSGRSARYCAGAADDNRDRRVRRGQSRPLGVPLPQPLSFGRRYDVGD